jgi:hypothetical protein
MISVVELWEVSLVTFPANEAAKITVVKQGIPAMQMIETITGIGQGNAGVYISENYHPALVAGFLFLLPMCFIYNNFMIDSRA